MAIGYLDDTYLSNIGDAIRAKSGTANTYTVAQMPAAIQNIPSTEQPRQFKDVNFFDYDGTILYQYTLAQAQALTALPALPSTAPTGYTVDSWTLDLSQLNNLTGIWDVGVNYTTTNKYTRIKVSIPENNYKVCSRGNYVANYSITIDWGDGTSSESFDPGEGKFHTYASAGDYYITISNGDNNYWLPLAYGTYYDGNTSNMYTSSRESGAMIMPYPYSNYATESYLIKEIWFGNNVDDSYSYVSLTNCKSLEVMMIPNQSKTYRLLMTYCPCKHLTVPSNVTINSSNYDNMGGPESFATAINHSNTNLKNQNARRFFGKNVSLSSSMFKNYTKLEAINTNSSPYNIPSDCFNGAWSLKSYVMPSTVTSVKQAAFNNSGLKDITFSSNLTSLGNYAFCSCSFTTLDLPAAINNMGIYCFVGCGCLEEVHIRANSPTIQSNAFQQCVSLRAVYLYSTTPGTTGSNLFNYVRTNFIIYVPAGCLETYQAASGWSTYASHIQEMAE